MNEPVQIALVADLHGNMPATEALEKDLVRRGIRRIFCLGDVVGKGPSSAEAFDWAFSRCELILQGNWEAGIGLRQFANDDFYYRQLGPERMKKLCELPLEYVFSLSGRKIRLFHGRPIMNELLVIQDDAALLSPLFDPDFDVVGYADAHRQGMRIVSSRGQLFNTGAVGNGLGLPMVQYAIMSGFAGDSEAPLDLTFITLPYDRERAVRDTRDAHELPNGALFEREILTGIYARNTGAPAQEQESKKRTY